MKTLIAVANPPAPTAPITYADLLLDYLNQLGIDTIFGVPGGAIEPLLNALARSARKGGPRLVVARHESGAAFMADGYYRESGKMGVVCSTTGPGATNLITGVASALLEDTPMLVITAQTPLPKFGKRALQESSCTSIDTVGMFRYVTLYNTLVSHEEQLEGKLIAAIMAAHRGPKGPTHISIPSDILRAPSAIPAPLSSNLLTHDFSMSDDVAIAQLCAKINSAANIVLYIGSGVGRASKPIQDFIDLTGAAFVSNPMGKTWVNEKHPQYRGIYGFAGHDSAKQLLQNTQIDLILAIGTALGELSTSGWNSEILNKKLVHIDSAKEHFTRSPMANLHVLGNIEVIFERVLASAQSAHASGKRWHSLLEHQPLNCNGGYATLKEPEKCQANSSPIKPQRLFCYLSQQLPENTRIFVDAGNGWAWATHYLTRSNNQGLYRIAMGYGSMAWSMPAAIGSAVANREAPTLSITGDGSYLMGAQELSVAAQQQLPIVFVVLNDGALGMVMHGQRLGNQESIGWELNRVNYAAQAEAMGARGIVIETSAQLEALNIAELFTLLGPTLLDIRIDAEEIPPMSDRVKGLADAKGSATPGG